MAALKVATALRCCSTSTSDAVPTETRASMSDRTRAAPRAILCARSIRYRSESLEIGIGEAASVIATVSLSNSLAVVSALAELAVASILPQKSSS